MGEYALVNGKENNAVSIFDRGFHYGDGLFETVLLTRGKPRYLAEHLKRLQAGCRRLGITYPQKEILADLRRIKEERGAVKIILTRGDIDRGLRLSGSETPNRVVFFRPLPANLSRLQTMGARIKICNTRLSCNPATSGMKLLNWLEPVLAARELEGFDEGLMLDYAGNIIEGTAANIFLVKHQTLYTPDLSACGLPGIIRAKIIAWCKQHNINVEQLKIRPERLAEYDGGFITNSIIGICPVASIEKLRFHVARLKKLRLNLTGSL